MSKDFVFISDFDGTITKKDFYWHFIDKYMKEEGNKKYDAWKRGDIKDIDFLGYVFKNIGQDENQIHRDIIEMEIDPYIREFVDFIHDRNGEFVVLSAGTKYYIDILFEHLKLQNITIYSNKAIYKDKGLHFDIDTTHEFYSERYGIDKKRVVEYLSTKYNKMYYAGDSMPDFEGSLLCDMRFATGKLVDIYNDNKVKYYQFETFKDIEKVLKKEDI